MNEKNYSPIQAAKICDVHYTTVYNWIKEGLLADRLTPGGHHRISESDLVKFLAKYKYTIPDSLRSRDSKKILIVEDNAAVRRLLHRLIANEFKNVEIHEAADGYEAGYKTLLLKPSLIILDLLLPCINGIKVCRMIRADKNISDAKILAISGYRPDRIRKVILRAGADAFMKKSFDNKDFLDVVSSLLGISMRGGDRLVFGTK